MGTIWAYSPPQPFTRRFAQIIVFNRPFTGLVERLSYKHLFLRLPEEPVSSTIIRKIIFTISKIIFIISKIIFPLI